MDAGAVFIPPRYVPPNSDLIMTLHISCQSFKDALEDLDSPTLVAQDKVCFMYIR